MQSRIYSFEIDRALVNAIYAAHDTSDGSPVTIYEWTPPVADREAAKLRLAGVQDEISAEVFSSDASLYLSAHTTDLAEQSLKTLQANNLFVGLELAPRKTIVANHPEELLPTETEPEWELELPPGAKLISKMDELEGTAVGVFLLLLVVFLAFLAVLAANHVF